MPSEMEVLNISQTQTDTQTDKNNKIKPDFISFKHDSNKCKITVGGILFIMMTKIWILDLGNFFNYGGRYDSLLCRGVQSLPKPKPPINGKSVLREKKFAKNQTHSNIFQLWSHKLSQRAVPSVVGKKLQFPAWVSWQIFTPNTGDLFRLYDMSDNWEEQHQQHGDLTIKSDIR